MKRIYNARNRFINPPPPGYRDWNLEFQVRVGGGMASHMCELQVHLLSIKRLIVLGDSHVHYSFFRSYFRGGERKAVQRRMDLLQRLRGSRNLLSAVHRAIATGGDALEDVDELLDLLCHYP